MSGIKITYSQCKQHLFIIMHPLQSNQTGQYRNGACPFKVRIGNIRFISQRLIMSAALYVGTCAHSFHNINNTQQIAILFPILLSFILKLWCRPAPLCLASILIKSVGTVNLLFETEASPNTHRTNNKQQPTLYSIYTSIYNKRERPVVYYLCPTGKLAIFSSKDNILNA